MTYHLKILDDAKNDIKRSFKWYEKKNEGLGFRFVDEVEITINYILWRASVTRDQSWL